MRDSRELYVFLIEDNAADARLVREAFKVSGRKVRLVSASNGAEALALLRRERPNLILLDLNLPAVDGREVLESLKSDKRMKHIPIAVLTSSDLPEDVIAAYRAGANCYVQKPLELNELFTRINGLIDFWADTAILPENA